ncbi:hypothetical protein [Mycoplasmopsis felifaucium]|nr:hypothetical protein [Mycoplasmopsis felifaucium]
MPKNWEQILVQNYGKNWSTPIKGKMTTHLGMYDMDVFTYKKKEK